MAEMKDDQNIHMQDMMERHIGSLASIMEADQEEKKAEMTAWREKIQAETEANRAKTKAMRNKRMEANINAC
jgi:hypothetical protein